MAVESVVETSAKSTLTLVTDPGAVEAIRLFRLMTPEQRAAWLVLGRAIVASNRTASSSGWKGAQA